ncbi:MAG: hypothetical protein HYR56_02255 [Acidobacteria bacterium]|nr:hypothetical protein [Acidobacteriota bacterium]MBI3421333.1 hypothetical protein [Acidobacteriota bacterium]
MSDDRKTVLIGDWKAERIQVLKDILADEFDKQIEEADNFNLLMAMVYQARGSKSPWRLVLVADKLKLNAYGEDVIGPLHIQQVLGVVDPSIEIRRICIHSLENWSNPDQDHYYTQNLTYLYVPLNSPTSEEYVRIVSTFKTVLKHKGAAPAIRLDNDPILREQVRALDERERNLERGTKILSYLIRNLNLGGKDVLVSKLGQGKSGARVFQFVTCMPDGEEHDYVLKLSPMSERWKLDLEISRHGQAKRAIGAYKIHVAELVTVDKSKPESDPARHIVEYGNWHAVCYDFLGGERFGAFLDLASAIVIAPEQLQTKTQHAHQQLKSDSDIQLRVELLKTKLDWLKNTWYLKASRKPRVLWEAADRPAKEYPQMPPYSLPGQAKGNILNFLADRDAEIGRHFFDDWDARVQLVRRFIEWPPSTSVAGLLGCELQVVVSPVHGDLNANNILLWLKEARPFLIDFPWYQDAGHAVQDLASLEFNLKFYLLDRQELNAPKHPLPALDHSPTQLPLWRELEKRLLADAVLAEAKQWQPKRCHSGNAALCWELLRCIRQAAVEVQGQKCGEPKPPEFFDEYLPALLFYTVRAIGYDLPLPKRLLAIYSASEILRKLQFDQPAVA